MYHHKIKGTVNHYLWGALMEIEKRLWFILTLDNNYTYWVIFLTIIDFFYELQAYLFEGDGLCMRW